MRLISQNEITAYRGTFDHTNGRSVMNVRNGNNLIVEPWDASDELKSKMIDFQTQLLVDLGFETDEDETTFAAIQQEIEDQVQAIIDKHNEAEAAREAAEAARLAAEEEPEE